jgi:hypothetical protein
VPTTKWSKETGPGAGNFAVAASMMTTATFSAPGANGRPAARPPASIVWIKEQK